MLPAGHGEEVHVHEKIFPLLVLRKCGKLKTLNDVTAENQVHRFYTSFVYKGFASIIKRPKTFLETGRTIIFFAISVDSDLKRILIVLCFNFVWGTYAVVKGESFQCCTELGIIRNKHRTREWEWDKTQVKHDFKLSLKQAKGTLGKLEHKPRDIRFDWIYNVSYWKRFPNELHTSFNNIPYLADQNLYKTSTNW